MSPAGEVNETLPVFAKLLNVSVLAELSALPVSSTVMTRALPRSTAYTRWSPAWLAKKLVMSHKPSVAGSFGMDTGTVPHVGHPGFGNPGSGITAGVVPFGTGGVPVSMAVTGANVTVGVAVAVSDGSDPDGVVAVTRQVWTTKFCSPSTTALVVPAAAETLTALGSPIVAVQHATLYTVAVVMSG